ncbi:nuclear transport factor 2 family protein [Streptomyces sp. NPDC056663]|uniref:nuclear transport factor 2 family protein n=1 Tax=Streptomyces sp. NPDC056663 TaxID=3345899 RepID=UPI00367593B2
MSTMDTKDPIARLIDAINSHDPQKVADCFTTDFRSEAPHRPDEGFIGNEQVFTNWTEIFGRLPNIRGRVLRRATAGEEFWAEFEYVGTGPDGGTVVLGGPAIIWVRDGLIARSRFYLAPVPTPKRVPTRG